MSRPQLVPHDEAMTIAAGGIAPLRAKLPAEERTSPVTARAYRHPGLDGDQVIVRLEPDAVAPGVDAEMAAFGFGEPEIGKPLGQVRYRTLGFPAWALVHQPAKAKIALAMAEGVRKAKRMVAAKPGHAKEAFEAMAKQLQKQAPQFLPSFWEEAGRTVADQASATMAAQMFERARQAERAFKLEIDPDDSDAVFVEFALLGALSAKTLSQYAKDIAKSAGGKEGYRRFRAIAVKRALGGMPPWSGMGKDIRALAAAAKLDLDAEDDALLTELLEAPGIAKSPTELWATYAESLERLAAKPEIRARLRQIWPEPRGGDTDARTAFKTAWLERLHELGALADVPDAGLAAFVSRAILYVGATPRVIAMMRELAPRLIANKEAISVIAQGRRYWNSDLSLDLAELALELGIPLVDPGDDDDFLRTGFTCDPVRVAAEPRYAKKLVALVSQLFGDNDGEAMMRGKAGFTEGRRQWLADYLDLMDKEPLLGVADDLEAFESKTTAETWLAFPDLYARFAATSVANALAITLRVGIADELTWPAYEAAHAAFGHPVGLGGAFPNLVLFDKVKAVALGASGVIAEHDFVYKAKEHAVADAFYLGGQFLVELKPAKGWGQSMGYWATAPKTLFEMRSLGGYGGSFPNAWTLPDGRITLGNKAFSIGEAPTEQQHYVCDGQRVWVRDRAELRELDLETGKKGAASAPAFLTGWDRDGWELQPYSCDLRPAPAGVTSSPLGVVDGLVGKRVRVIKDDDKNDVEGERIDGVRTDHAIGFALVVFPGDPAPRRLDTESFRNVRFPDGDDGPGAEIYTIDGTLVSKVNGDDWASAGWGSVPVPPAQFWHYLTPRDPAGSAGLRAITTEQAAELLAATTPEARAELARTRLGVTTAALATGVAAVAAHAAELQAKLAEIVATCSKENADASGGALTPAGQQLRKMARALVDGRELKIADFDTDVRPWLLAGRAHATMALSPIGKPEDRRTAREILGALADSPLADDVSRVRILEITEPEDWSDPTDWNTLVVTKLEGSTFAIHGSDNWAIEYSTDGTFRVPPPWKLGKATTLDRAIGSAWIRGYLELPDAPVPWQPEIAPALAAASGLSVPEATLLWIGAEAVGRYGKDFLGKPNRELLGIKMGEADAARTTFRDLDDDVLPAMFARGAPDDPALLLTPLAPGGLVAGLGAAWKAKFGKRAKIPQDVVAGLKKGLDLDRELGKLLPAFAGDLDVYFLKPDLRPFPELGGWRDEHGLDPSTAEDVATLAAWLAFARPVGCAIRAGVPAVIAKLRAVLDDPRVIWKLDSLYVGDEDDKDKKRRAALLDMVGGAEVTFPKDDEHDCVAARDDGLRVIAQYHSAQGGFRPAKLDGKGAHDRVDALARALHDSDDGEFDGRPLAIAELLRGDGFAAIAERIATTDVPVGSYEANPLASVPKLVAKIAKEHGISQDAAALYLQVLALAEPTERAVQDWNGWKPKQYKDAAAELVKKKLVVEGKRERAGRSIFVAGGYDKGDGRNLPMEDWKQPFYGAIARHIPVEPCHLLFARAWKRVESGD